MANVKTDLDPIMQGAYVEERTSAKTGNNYFMLHIDIDEGVDLEVLLNRDQARLVQMVALHNSK